MMDKQPDMDTSYADYLAAQLETSKEKFTEEGIYAVAGGY